MHILYPVSNIPKRWRLCELLSWKCVLTSWQKKNC